MLCITDYNAKFGKYIKLRERLVRHTQTHNVSKIYILLFGPLRVGFYLLGYLDLDLLFVAFVYSLVLQSSHWLS